MPLQLDWLSHLLDIIKIAGQLEIRCAYGAPWRVPFEQAPAREIPYHVVLKGRAVLEDPQGRELDELTSGDIVLLPRGSAHVLHDGSGRAPAQARMRQGANLMVTENDGTGERLDMLCGRFFVAPPHDRLVRDYLPATLVVRTGVDVDAAAAATAAEHLATLMGLMRAEAGGDRLGGHAMLNALSSALFALTLRAASEAARAPTGLLALAANPRLAPAIAAMVGNPAQPWTLPELATLCSMSRATFMRHFQDGLGRSAMDFLTDIRMSLAANELAKPGATAEAVAELAGYQSVAAFRRVFAQWMGMTPGAWRRLARGGDSADTDAVALADDPNEH